MGFFKSQVQQIILAFLFSTIWLYGQPKDQLTQVSTIDALLAGAYDGVMNTSEFKNYGNFGLGTFDKLDGEMIVLNGDVYQARYDGKVIKTRRR